MRSAFGSLEVLGLRTAEYYVIQNTKYNTSEELNKKMMMRSYKLQLQ